MRWITKGAVAAALSLAAPTAYGQDPGPGSETDTGPGPGMPPETDPELEELPDDPDDPGDTDGDEEPASLEAVLEFHFQPVPDLQVAIWLETPEGEFVEDIFVTQATGKLGIGNRPGIWNFLSSWRAPYGPRLSVLPVWGHRRGKTYPRVLFHDDESRHTSLGFHEGTSSPEPYFCRPLKPEEQENIMDVLTCPSPSTFQSDKGRIESGEESVYPPRNDLTFFEPGADHDDARTWAEINDLDAITGATPGSSKQVITHRLAYSEDLPPRLVAWIEVNLEGDQNLDWSYDRENDHFVDPRLTSYGVPYLGQPSIVYRVEFDPAAGSWEGTPEYAGYGAWNGESGAINDPDDSISGDNGSGADRLQVFRRQGEDARFGVFSHGWTDVVDSGLCGEELPPVEELHAEATAFDTVQLTFRLPEELPGDVALNTIHAYHQPESEQRFDRDQAVAVAGMPTLCRDDDDDDCISAGPGDEVTILIEQLWGNYSYDIAVTYRDICAQESELNAINVVTPTQEFATIDGFCFIATAAYGGQWVDEVSALRYVRDAGLRKHDLGRDVIRFYYEHGPRFAKMIEDSPYLRATARVLLQPVASTAVAAKRQAIFFDDLRRRISD